LLEHLYGQGAQVRGRIDYWEVSTPVVDEVVLRLGARRNCTASTTIRTRMRQRWLRPRTKVRDCGLTGQDIMSCGVSGAMMGGLAAATADRGVRRLCARH